MHLQIKRIELQGSDWGATEHGKVTYTPSRNRNAE
jgi:hypothetical protein